MVEINLLPWRADARAKKKKIIKWMMLVLCAVSLLWWMASNFLSPVSSTPNAATVLPKKSVPRSPKSLYKISGFIHQNERTWGIAKYPNGEVRELASFSVPQKELVAAFSLDFRDIKLIDALRILAKFLHLNVELNPTITGWVSLHLENSNPQLAFDTLIQSHNLSKTKIGDIWYVTTRKEFAARQEDKKKFQAALDESTPLLTQTWQIQYAKAEDIGRLLQDNNYSLLSKYGHVRVDARTNILCVQELPDKLKAVHSLIQKFDIPVQQVLIEARLASVDSDFERQLGIDFSSRQEPTPSSGGGARFSLAVAKLAGGSLLDVTLTAMENEGRGELISSPRLFTANQQTASIEAGEEIPYQEVSRSGGTGVAFKKAVLSLKVTPHILPGNKVMLQLQVNQDRPSSRIVLGVPAITTRQITTNILIRNGQTLVLGGIYEVNKEHSEQRIPFLGKIPLVGLLFQQQNAKESKRELLIFVTPKIISES